MLSIFALAAVVFQLSSCAKESTPKVVTYPIEGLWIGTYTADGITGESFYSFIIYPDHSLVTRGKGFDGNYYYSSGIWTLSSDNVFSGTTVSFVTPVAGTGLSNPVTQTITATFSNTGTLTNGIWKDVINSNDKPLTGTYSTMTRVN